MHQRSELLAEDPTESERRHRLIVEFWQALDDEGDAGATTWEALVRLRDKVTTALLRRPPDIGLAERLTARAALLLAGHGDK